MFKRYNVVLMDKRTKICAIVGGAWGFVNGILLMLGYISPAEHPGEFVVPYPHVLFPAFMVNELSKIIVPILLILKDALPNDIHPLIIIILTGLFIIILSTAIGSAILVTIYSCVKKVILYI